MRCAGLMLALLGLSCGVKPPVDPAGCCLPTAIQRNRLYEGTTSTDGGGTMRVGLVVLSSGGARLIFVRDGAEISQDFSTAP